jgi:hypothetical protein
MDNKLRCKNHNFVIGDRVYVKAAPGNKSTPRYEPDPYLIIKVNGSMIEAERNDKRIVRNCSFFRKFYQMRKNEDNLKPIPIINVTRSPSLSLSQSNISLSNLTQYSNSQHCAQNDQSIHASNQSTLSDPDDTDIINKFQIEHEIEMREVERPDVDDLLTDNELNSDSEENERARLLKEKQHISALEIIDSVYSAFN